MSPASITGQSPTSQPFTRSEQSPDAPAHRGLGRRFHDWRESIRDRPKHHRVYQVTVGVLGSAIVVAGLALLPLPGPGWLIIFVGLAVLASEFKWAKRLEAFARRHVHTWNEWLKAQNLAVRLVLWTLMALFVLAVVYGSLVLTGIPGWVPQWLVPPLPGL